MKLDPNKSLEDNKEEQRRTEASSKMSQEEFVAICKQSLAKAWNLDVDDIYLINSNISGESHPVLFFSSRKSQVNYIATASYRIQFNIYKLMDCFMSEEGN